MKSVEGLVEEIEKNRKAQELLKAEEAEEASKAEEAKSGLEVYTVEPVIQKTLPPEELEELEKKIKTEEPVIEKPVIEKPAIEEPVIEEPVIKEPVKAEEPVIEEPVKAEEPVIEEPVEKESEYEFTNPDLPFPYNLLRRKKARKK